MSDESSLNRARAAKAKAHRLFSAIGEVVGVGITSIGSDYGLKVNLGSAPREGVAIPDEVDGVPIRVEVVREIRKRGATPDFD